MSFIFLLGHCCVTIQDTIELFQPINSFELRGNFLSMRYQQQRDLLLVARLSDQINYALLVARINIGSRFVCQKQLGTISQSTRYSNTLLFTH